MAYAMCCGYYSYSSYYTYIILLGLLAEYFLPLGLGNAKVVIKQSVEHRVTDENGTSKKYEYQPSAISKAHVWQLHSIC